MAPWRPRANSKGNRGRLVGLTFLLGIFSIPNITKLLFQILCLSRTTEVNTVSDSSNHSLYLILRKRGDLHVEIATSLHESRDQNCRIFVNFQATIEQCAVFIFVEKSQKTEQRAVFVFVESIPCHRKLIGQKLERRAAKMSSNSS